MAFRIVALPGRSFLTVHDRAKALARIVKGEPCKEVVEEVYSEAGREIPKSDSMVVSNWKKSVQAAISKGNNGVLELCKTLGIIEEGDPPVPNKRGPRKETAKATKGKK